MATLEEFRAATAAELARLNAIAKAVRRNLHQKPCGDEAPCTTCRVMRDTHRHINDHLNQLEEAELEAAFEAVA